MIDRDRHELTTEQSEEYNLNLPVDPSKLGDFISGLLGQPQAVSRFIEGFFIVDLAWIQKIHHLLLQRISQQHQASLVDFSSRFLYQDGLLRELRSPESFLAYVEHNEELCTGVEVKWTFLIHFPNKSIPEKQEISLTIYGGDPNYLRTEDAIEYLFGGNGDRNGFMVEIRNTERTWGDDVLNILTQHIKKIVKTETPLERGLGISSRIFGYLLLCLGWIIPAQIKDYYNSIYARNRYSSVIDEITRRASESTSVEELAEISTKLDILFWYRTLFSPSYWGAAIYLFSILAFCLSGYLLLQLGRKKKHPCIVINEFGEKYASKIVKDEKIHKLTNIFSFFAAIMAGILANYAYYFLS